MIHLILASFLPASHSAALSGEMLLGIALSIAAGAVLGIERELHGRAAGFRTTTLVCFSSCLLMMVSKYAFEDGTFDSSRVAAGVVSGMGFLGAGAIIRHSDHAVQGVTTAATLWCATAIGLAFGGGGEFLWIGLLATVLAYLVLTIFHQVERGILSNRYVDFAVVFNAEETSVEKLMEAIGAFPTKVISIRYGTRADGPLRDAVFSLCYKAQRAGKLSVPLTDRIASLPGVRSAEWRG